MIMSSKIQLANQVVFALIVSVSPSILEVSWSGVQLLTLLVVRRLITNFGLEFPHGSGCHLPPIAYEGRFLPFKKNISAA